MTITSFEWNFLLVVVLVTIAVTFGALHALLAADLEA
jgi:hypothetical protein